VARALKSDKLTDFRFAVEGTPIRAAMRRAT
jgi:hypothetical protein